MTQPSAAAKVRRSWRGVALYAVPPAAWMGHLLVSYLLVPPACDRSTVPLHLTTAVFVLAAAGATLAGRTLRRSDRRAGTALGWFFVFIIALQGAANAVVDPCA